MSPARTDRNDITLRSGIRSNSIAAPATTSTAGTSSAAWAYRTTSSSKESQRASLRPGAVRGEQRDGDEVQVDEEAERALGPAGHVHRPGEEETVEEDHDRDERQPASLRRPSGQFVGHGDRRVDATDGEELDEVDAQDLGPDDGPARDDDGHPETKEQKGRHTVAEGRVFEALGGMHQTSASSAKRTVVSEEVSGARRSFGSRSSMRPWMIRKNSTASISASGNPKVWAMAEAASGLTAVLTPLTTSVTTAPTKACGSNRTAPPSGLPVLDRPSGGVVVPPPFGAPPVRGGRRGGRHGRGRRGRRRWSRPASASVSGVGVGVGDGSASGDGVGPGVGVRRRRRSGASESGVGVGLGVWRRASASVGVGVGLGVGEGVGRRAGGRRRRRAGRAASGWVWASASASASGWATASGSAWASGRRRAGRRRGRRASASASASGVGVGRRGRVVGRRASGSASASASGRDGVCSHHIDTIVALGGVDPSAHCDTDPADQGADRVRASDRWTYETVQGPAVPVSQSRSGLLPGLLTSFGSPAVKQNLTCMDEPVDTDHLRRRPGRSA